MTGTSFNSSSKPPILITDAERVLAFDRFPLLRSHTHFHQYTVKLCGIMGHGGLIINDQLGASRRRSFTAFLFLKYTSTLQSNADTFH